MGYEVKILEAADEEVNAILDYLGNFGAKTAQNFSDEYEKQLRLLASGVVDYGLSHLPELAEKGYHSCQVNNYAMLYFYEDDAVVIAHIFHQSQDYARLI